MKFCGFDGAGDEVRWDVFAAFGEACVDELDGVALELLGPHHFGGLLAGKELHLRHSPGLVDVCQDFGNVGGGQP